MDIYICVYIYICVSTILGHFRHQLTVPCCASPHMLVERDSTNERRPTEKLSCLQSALCCSCCVECCFCLFVCCCCVLLCVVVCCCCLLWCGCVVVCLCCCVVVCFVGLCCCVCVQIMQNRRVSMSMVFHIVPTLALSVRCTVCSTKLAVHW
jgi:hypothetical protein